MVDVVARDEELDALDAFLAAPVPAVLVLEGAAGVGKTTLWEAAVARAEREGMRVMRARPVQSEAQLSYVAVADLLEPVAEDVLPRLTAPLRRALEVALLLDEPEAGGEVSARAVGTAVAAGVAVLAEDGPLLLAIDDVHWLDPASATAIGFVLRRLGDRPVRALLAERPGEAAPALALDRAPVGEMLQRLPVRPFSLGALQRLLIARLGSSPPRPALRRLHEVSGGNPFHALELARVEAGEELPEAIRTVVRRRLAGFPHGTREALLHVALLAAPSLGVLDQALNGDPAERLAPACEGGMIVVRGGQVAFGHPLYASALVLDAAEDERRAVHATLAQVAQTAEERARHLAMSRSEPDATIAAELEHAAEQAFARGAAAAAAKLASEAARLTPEGEADERSRRTIRSGVMMFVAGDSENAESVLAAAVDAAPSERLRARALAGLARVRHLSHNLREAIDLYRQGIEIGVDDAALMAEMHEGLAWVTLLRRRDLRDAAEAARSAVEWAARAGDAVTHADALSALFQIELLLGGGYPEQRISEALTVRSEAFAVRILRDPRMHQGLALLAVDRLDEACDTYVGALHRAAESGDEGGLPFVTMRLSHALFLRGDVASAMAQAREGLRLAVDSRQRPREAALHCLLALCLATGGGLEEARTNAVAGLELARETDDGIARRFGAWALGVCELLAGHPEAALAHLEPLHAESVEAGIADPGENRHLADLVEALIGAGRVDEAEALALELHQIGIRLVRPSAQAIALRGLALAAAARGDHDAAVAHGKGALDLDVPLPLDVARTRLALGGILRRARRRREAREVLGTALAELEALGAGGWARLAREEIGRIGGRPPGTGELTPAERAVAELVASGRTNREAAASLCVTDRTVETHLSRVYAKLDVRSRAELAAQFRAGR